MAIFDINTLLSDDQDLSQTTGTYYSDVLDTQSASVTTSNDAPSGVGADKAKGNPLLLWARVSETFTSGGAATLTVTIQTDDNDSFSSATTVLTSKTFALAELTAGTYVLPQHIPYGLERYVRIGYTIGTATTTAGTVTAGLTMGQQSNE